MRTNWRQSLVITTKLCSSSSKRAFSTNNIRKLLPFHMLMRILNKFRSFANKILWRNFVSWCFQSTFTCSIKMSLNYITSEYIWFCIEPNVWGNSLFKRWKSNFSYTAQSIQPWSNQSFNQVTSTSTRLECLQRCDGFHLNLPRFHHQ